MILHIPHASVETLDKSFLCDVELELERMTGARTNELFQYPRAKSVVFPISRLLCDVERFENDADEVMASKGMGVCYTTNSFGEPLRNVDKKERKAIINEYYRPHHEALSKLVEDELRLFNKSLIIDCHSFSNTPLQHESSQVTPRPDICIGADSFHTPKAMIHVITKHFASFAYTVCVNEPFAGTLIPMAYYKLDARVQGVMIEVNRDLYKDNFD